MSLSGHDNLVSDIQNMYGLCVSKNLFKSLFQQWYHAINIPCNYLNHFY